MTASFEITNLGKQYIQTNHEQEGQEEETLIRLWHTTMHKNYYNLLKILPSIHYRYALIYNKPELENGKMKATKPTPDFISRALFSCTLLVVLNTLLIFLLPSNNAVMAAYHLSGFQYKIIYFAISIPSFLVWYA